MAHRVFWIIEDRVLNTSMFDEITLDDFRESSAQIADMMDAAYSRANSGIIIGIIDLTGARFGTLMRSALTVTQEISTVIDARLWHAKPGFVILITTSDLAKLLTSVIIKISRQPMTTVGTRDEALTVVCYMYPEMQGQIDTYRSNRMADAGN